MNSVDDADPKPTASVYIDGFNLYRRLLEGHPQHKWLYIEALADRVLPDYRVTAVSYFTAIIKALPGKDVSSPQRQQAYLRALATLRRTEIYLGKFRIDPRIMPLHPTVLDADGEPKRVKVLRRPRRRDQMSPWRAGCSSMP